MKQKAEIANRLMCVIPLLIAGVLMGGVKGCCPSLSPAPSQAFVADAANNRVLIYDSPFSTDETASVVLGQAGFGTSGPGTSATTMNFPTGVAVDTAGNLYVADSSNCRVLQFQAPLTTNGKAASLVFGEPDLNTSACQSTQAGLRIPVGVALDGSGNLWVADYSLSRVVEYELPFSSGMKASQVIGQPNFTSSGCNQGGISDTTLCFPEHIAFDSAGNLWVADQINSRVLMYPKANLTTNGAAATVVIGQPNFASSDCNTSQNGLCAPSGVAFDSGGNLWVADTLNCRVLMYPQENLGTNGANATLELGWAPGPNFDESCTINENGQVVVTPTASALYPFGLAFDSSGDLFVADYLNSRTMVFSPSPSFTSGMGASYAIGQANLTSGFANQGLAAPTAATQYKPYDVAF